MSDVQSTATTFLGYTRVSTARQGASGLGLEAQQSAVNALAARLGGTVQRWFTEVESGRNNERPQLAAALAHAKRARATILFAKIDRLARNARFLLSIVESGADVLFCDLPTIPSGPIGKFILTQMAAVAELEAGLIGQRTRAALAALRARGVALGSARPGHWTGREHLRSAGLVKARAASHQSIIDGVREAYADLLPTIRDMRSGGASLGAIARKLTDDGLLTRRGKRWSASQVLRVLRTKPTE